MMLILNWRIPSYPIEKNRKSKRNITQTTEDSISSSVSILKNNKSVCILSFLICIVVSVFIGLSIWETDQDNTKTVYKEEKRIEEEKEKDELVKRL